MKVIYGLFALFVEVAMLVALALWAFSAIAGAGGYGLAVVVVGVVAGIWGTFLSPKARRPLGKTAAVTSKTVLFTAAAALIAVSGFGIFGVALGVGGLALVALEVTVGTAASRMSEVDRPQG